MREDDSDVPVVEIVVNPDAIWITVGERPVLGLRPEIAVLVGEKLAEGAALYEKHYRAFVLPGPAAVN